MVRITEEMVRRKSEHNEGEIFSLEELSLHQENIEAIEHLDKWSRELKILYLQSNLIAKIQNLNRLKKLQYLNLALNNITRIENLQGCESLEKLDLTVNFIGELTSVESLKVNTHLKELYLTGNPCTDFEMYREYVVATLPQLKSLDGRSIEKSERIKATQIYNEARQAVTDEEKEYLATEQIRIDRRKETDEKLREEPDETYWKQVSDHTPETRIEINRRVLESNKKDDGDKNKKPRRKIRLQTDDGRILNINEAKIDFKIIEDEENNQLKLDLAVYRYLDSSLLSVDVNPTYVTVYIKGKVFQMTLQEEVNPDTSMALRSETTGHLVISMPKVKQVVRPHTVAKPKAPTLPPIYGQRPSPCDESPACLISCIDICSIIPDPTRELSPPYEICTKITDERQNSSDFVDDPSVPPLV